MATASLDGPGIVTVENKHMNYEYGKAVANWLPATSAYGLRLGTDPHTYDKVQEPDGGGGGGGGGGCFIAGTQLLLANGTTVDISKVKEGLEVLTRDMGVGVVSAEKVKSLHKVGDLYGINDDTPFFTGSHVFYTPTGLRSLKPSISRKENSWLEVNHLREGDYVYQMDRVVFDKSGLYLSCQLP
jgi:hypothetical protein